MCVADLPDNQGAHSLQGLLESMCVKLAGAEDVACDFCGDWSKPKFCQLEYPIDDMPQVMVFQLRRLHESGKRMDKVFRETRLSLGSASFALVGILQHVGDGVNSGHYITTIRLGEGWQTRNDALCTDFQDLPDEEDNMGSEAYLFAYQQMPRDGSSSDAGVSGSGSSRPGDDISASP